MQFRDTEVPVHFLLAFFTLFSSVSPGVTDVSRDAVQVALLETKLSKSQVAEPVSNDGLSDAASALFVSIQSGEAIAPDALKRFGFDVSVVTVEGQQWAVVSESEKRGSGTYVFRTGAVDQEVVVQAPHVFHDIHTFQIAFDMFAGESVRGFFFNTAHREHVDVAHAHHTAFEEFTSAFVQSTDDAVVVQVHGFADRNAASDAIVSNGTKQPTALTRAFAERFDADVFGVTATKYGATTNTIGKMVRRAGAEFVHIELSRTRRNQMSSVLAGDVS